MQTATIRIYDDAACCNLRSEAPIPRVEAMEQILAGFRAATEIATTTHRTDALRNRGRWLRWAGYDPYEPAAPLGQRHLTRVQLYPAICVRGYEYVFPDGLSPIECDDLCLNVVGEDEDTDEKRELLVTSAAWPACCMPRASRWRIMSSTSPAAGRFKSMSPPGLRSTGNMSPDSRRSASSPPACPQRYMPPSATAAGTRRSNGCATPRPCSNDILRRFAWNLPCGCRQSHQDRQESRSFSGIVRDWDTSGSRGAEAAAYVGSSIEFAVSAAGRGDWLSDREAALMAGMCLGQWRQWIENAPPLGTDRQADRQRRAAGRNRRLIHREDLRRASGWRAVGTRARRFAIRRNAG